MRHISRDSLSDWYRREVRPHLRAERVFADVELRREGSRLRGPCPLCQSADRRVLSVDARTCGWRCHRCDRSGDALAWLAGGETPRGDAFRQTVVDAAAIGGVPVPDWVQRGPRIAPDRPAGGRKRLLPASGAGSAGMAHDRPREAQNGNSGPIRRAGKPPDRLRGPDAGPDPQEIKRALDAARPADGTPAEAYLAARWAWPIGLDGWTLPDDVLWLPRDGCPRRAGSLPPGAAGAIAFVLRDSAGTARGLKLEALDDAGKPALDAKNKRWRRAPWPTKGRRFVACDLPGGHVHIGEGEVTALAFAIRCTVLGRGMAVAAGGTSGLRNAGVAADLAGRPVMIHADRDKKGRNAARELAAALRAEGRAVSCAALTAKPHHAPDCPGGACPGCAPCPAGPQCKRQPGEGCLGCDGRDFADMLEGCVRGICDWRMDQDKGLARAAARTAAWEEALAGLPDAAVDP